jgi:sporulation protein YlmC with PRC-barrel domain
MKHVFLTACAVTALCGTALAQTPAAKDSMTKDNMNKPGVTTQSQTTTPATEPSNMKPGMMAARPHGTVQVTYYTVKPADVQASKLMGATVYNANNENIGEIEDLVIDDGKTLRAVVISVGGFLGIGEHDVAVEPHALVVTHQKGDPNDIRIVLNTNKEDLKNAPAVKFDKASRDKAAATDAKPMTTGAAPGEPLTDKNAK